MSLKPKAVAVFVTILMLIALAIDVRLGAVAILIGTAIDALSLWPMFRSNSDESA
jgi:hypothetical protein